MFIFVVVYSAASRSKCVAVEGASVGLRNRVLRIRDDDDRFSKTI